MEQVCHGMGLHGGRPVLIRVSHQHNGGVRLRLWRRIIVRRKIHQAREGNGLCWSKLIVGRLTQRIEDGGLSSGFGTQQQDEGWMMDDGIHLHVAMCNMRLIA